MPKPLDGINAAATPGNHPDAAPDNAIARNTAALATLATEVVDHKARMTGHTEAMNRHTIAMEEHRTLMQAHLAATSETTAASRDSSGQMAELLTAIKSLNQSVDDLSALLKAHSTTSAELRDSVERNTASMRELKRI